MPQPLKNNDKSFRLTKLDLFLLLGVQPVFRVMGFSVMGRVLNSADGEGVSDATVSLNNQIKGERQTLTILDQLSELLNQSVWF